MKGFHDIRIDYSHLEILFKVTENHLSDWHLLSEQDVMKEAMQISKGHVNPAVMRKLIKQYNSLDND